MDIGQQKSLPQVSTPPCGDSPAHILRRPRKRSVGKEQILRRFTLSPRGNCQSPGVLMKTATSAMVLLGILVYMDAFVNPFLALGRVELKKQR